MRGRNYKIKQIIKPNCTKKNYAKIIVATKLINKMFNFINCIDFIKKETLIRVLSWGFKKKNQEALF